MYIRTKTRTNKSGNTYIYAYLAKIRRPRKKPKQKIVKYLGRVFTFSKTGSKQPEINLNQPLRNLFCSLIKVELENHGFREIAPQKLRNEGIEVDMSQVTITNKNTGKRVCIQLNQGMLCEETLKNILEYSPPQENMRKISQHFAKTVIEVGIQAQETIIVQIFQKIQTMINNKQRQTMPNTPEKI